MDAAANHPEDPAQRIQESGYTQQQRFSVDQGAFSWKKMPSRTFIAGEDKSMPGFEHSKDRLTLLSGADAADDSRWKPVLIHRPEDPTALQNDADSTLPCSLNEQHSPNDRKSVCNNY